MKEEEERNYSYTRTRYTCEVCGRSDESDANHLARAAILRCEESCRALAAEGKVRVFLPPPGGYDRMFANAHWRIMRADALGVVCARHGHIEQKRWVPSFDRTITIADSRGYPVHQTKKREIEQTHCLHCGDFGYFSSTERDAGSGEPVVLAANVCTCKCICGANSLANCSCWVCPGCLASVDAL